MGMHFPPKLGGFAFLACKLHEAWALVWDVTDVSPGLCQHLVNDRAFCWWHLYQPLVFNLLLNH